MIELVPANTTRVIARLVKNNDDTGDPEPATGLNVIVRVAETATSTGAIGVLSYNAQELVEEPGVYVAMILGADITSALTSYMNQRVVVQVLESTNLKGYYDAIVRPVRNLGG